jgi:hypothetical protein
MAQEALDAFRAYGSQQKAADALGIPRPTLQARLAKASLYGMDGTGPVLNGFEISSISTQRGPDGETQREWVKQKPEAGGTFEVPAGHVVKGVSALVGADGRTVQQWVKTKEGDLGPEAWADIIKAALADFQHHRQAQEPPPSDDSLAVFLPVSDAHFGLYAHGPEAGEDYDLGIADRTNRDTFARLIDATPASGHAVIVGLGDLLHADNPSNQTTNSGHALDVDTRHSKVRKTAVMYMIFCTEKALERHAKVTVRVLPGNHDEVTAGAIALALWAWFRNDDRVTVDIDPSRFWWWRFGANLLGATHGDQAKMQALPMLMAATRPKDWGETRHRFIACGHIHTKTALEIGGVIVESFQSTAARDAWHAGMGYKAGRSMQAIVLHEERGEIGRHRVVI